MTKTLKPTIFFILFTLILVLSVSMTKASAEEAGETMTILFTHDLHDHLLPVRDKQKGALIDLGGFARLQSAILLEKKSNPNALLVDAGDYSMGTPFQAIFKSHSPQLRIMGEMGYDVTTFGNHEYDYQASGLAHSLTAALESGDRLPQLVQSNVIFPTDSNGSLTPSLMELKRAYQDYGVKDYTIIERNGVRVGIFGLMGKDAASMAPMSEVKFTDPIESARRVVKVLQQQEKADLIICLSHSGTWDDGSESEDELLAEKVPEIDVIISGHTHTKLSEPIMVGKTIIGSIEDSCRYLGVMEISKEADSGWKLDSYRLQQIDDSLPDHPHISETIEQYKELVQENYFDHFHMDFDQVLAVSPFSFQRVNDISDNHNEDPLGNLISDAYIYAVEKAEGENYIPVDVTIVPVGTIRSSIFQGNITVADAFNVSSLGIGPDNVPGYPLISVYLTGKELKTACEVDASVSPIMDDAQLFISGMNFTFNPNRLIFNKVTDTYLQRPDGSIEEIDDAKLYRVVAGLFSARMLSVVGDKSFGLLSIVPKTKEGLPIIDFESHIVKDIAGGSNKEVKEWLAIARYLQSFNKVNGVPQIPAYYSNTHGRKVVDNNLNIFALVGSPNQIALAVYAIAIAVIALVALIVIRIAARRKRLKPINNKPYDMVQ